jgi:hypothetical protein
MEWVAAAILVVISASVSGFQWWAHDRPVYQRSKDAISSFSALTNTTAGVMLAIAITLHYQEKAALEQADAQLKVAANEVRQVEDAVVGALYVAVRDGTPGTAAEPLPSINMLHALITGQTFSAYADPLTIHIFNSVNNSIPLAQSRYLSAAYDEQQDVVAEIKGYLDLVSRYRDALSVEGCYFRGQINSDERHELLKDIETQRVKSTLTGETQRSEAHPCLPKRAMVL